MGQQQLLLLVVGIVIVGLAVVVGIQAFSENQKKANADALVNNVVRVAADAQAWTLKPAAFDGGNGTFGTADDPVSLTKLGYTLGGVDAAEDSYGNLNGSYSLTLTTPGVPGVLTVVGCNGARGNLASATVRGTGPDDIATSVEAIEADGCANEE